MDGMALALAEAERALREGEIPVGAVLVRGDEILWADHNRREQAMDPTAHAEMLCLRHGAVRRDGIGRPVEKRRGRTHPLQKALYPPIVSCHSAVSHLCVDASII